MQSTVHPDRPCFTHCHTCNIKFGSLDIPFHPLEFESDDLQQNALDDEIPLDSCICQHCKGKLKKKQKLDSPFSESPLEAEEDSKDNLGPCNVPTCKKTASKILAVNGKLSDVWREKYKTEADKSVCVCGTHLSRLLKVILKYSVFYGAHLMWQIST